MRTSGRILRSLLRLLGLSNWPFALKMAFCPALAMVVLTAMGGYGILAINEQAVLINAVVNHDLPAVMGLSASANRLQDVNSHLYRLSTLQASNAIGLNVTQEIEQLVAQTTLLADDLEKQARISSMTAVRYDIQAVAASVRVYR